MSLQNIFPFLLAVLGAVYIAIIPPLESPDEPAHVKRAYLLAHGQLILDTPPGQTSGGLVDAGLSTYLHERRSFSMNPESASARTELARLSQIEWMGTRTFTGLPNTGYNFPLAYAPQALGLRLGELLSLTVETSYFLARGCVLAFCVVLLMFSIQLMPANPLVIAFLLLPMSLFQFASASLDGVATAISVLVISLFLRCADTRRPFSMPAMFAMSACVLVVATARMQVLPLVLLPLYLFFVRRSPLCLWTFLVVAALSMAWVGYVSSTIMDIGLDVVRKARQPEVVTYYLGHPIDFVRVLVNTLLEPHMMTGCLTMFIGVLGWLDTPFQIWFYVLSLVVLGVASACAVQPIHPADDHRPRLLLLALAALSVLFVFAALLANWTPHPATIVVGLQGRYFIVPALLAAYALSGPDYPGEARRRAAWGSLTVIAWVVLAAFVMTQTLVARYYAPV